MFDKLYLRAAKYFRARLKNTLDVTAVYWGHKGDVHVAKIVGNAHGRTVAIDVPIYIDDLRDNLEANIEPIQAKIAELFEAEYKKNGK